MIWYVGRAMNDGHPNFVCAQCGALFYRPRRGVPSEMVCPGCHEKLEVRRASKYALPRIIYRYLKSGLWDTKDKKGRKRPWNEETKTS